MFITLKNGEEIKLKWNPLIFEKLEDYEGGLEKLQQDASDKHKKFSVINFVIYAVISISYPENLNYKQAISLVDPSDIEKIMNFVDENIEKVEISQASR